MSRKLINVCALLLLVAAPALATVPDAEFGQLAGYVNLDLSSGNVNYTPGSTGMIRAAGDVYNNTDAPAVGGSAISSTNFTSVWGDRMTTLGTGILKENSFTVYNSSSSTSAMSSASFAINIYDGPTGNFIGGYTTGTVTFSPALAIGFFSIINVTGIAPLAINIPTTDIIITQNIVARVGSTRAGVVSMNPLLAGTSSPDTMYINSPTIGAAGFYSLGTGVQANPGYRVNIPEPASLALLGLASLGLIVRRRR